jgi:hypothetical protein
MTYRKKKRWLLRYCKANKLPIIKGFNPRVNKWGRPAQLMWRNVCLKNKIPVTREPNANTLLIITPFRVRLVNVAKSQLGVKEWPEGSNWGAVKKFLAAAGLNMPAPWCACFVTWVLKKAGWKGPMPGALAWVPSWDVWGKRHDYEIPKLRAGAGDIVTFNWDSDSASEHIGLVLKNLGPYKEILTLEGNASSSAIPGGGVVKKYRSWRTVNHVYRLPNY